MATKKKKAKKAPAKKKKAEKVEPTPVHHRSDASPPRQGNQFG